MREELITTMCRTAGALTGRLASRQDTVPPPNPRIVILRRCCLGDVLSSTAMLDALRRRYPLAQIDYATGDYSRPALAGNPDLSGMIQANLAALRERHYDVAISLERSPRAGMLPWLARIPIRVGPNNLGRGFAHNLRVACPPGRSEAELALDCAAALGVAGASARTKFCPSPEDDRRAEALLAEHSHEPAHVGAQRAASAQAD
ncbi:MAG: glycosyltransferase family 9 protein, partial [Chloroflexota bacterium]